jgi:glycine/D-amino acid oxidase-like deaminating enzyme
VAELAAEARALLPGLAVTSVRGDSCVTSNTPGKLAPFLDTLAPGLVLAAGGCGHAAMGSDEIGRLAAVLALEGRWDSPLPRSLFRVQLQPGASL